ncbi:MAG: hypothetical protein A3K19_28140 [Lentisphaerae bacterium RIFOXYB12_FULL_65_16]|nr:MAG: hypothetical protein A3K18_34300 [Lentisphaerae bacterium RIFOXYA12_64_32]OGV85462.1 MAG: hypothetical protein A3K19_28140 [Lentisphaerae bacterium RIFOXYB12_FULL_65_16]
MRREPRIPRVPIRLTVTFCHVAVVVLLALPAFTRVLRPPPLEIINVSLLGLPGATPIEEAAAVEPEPEPAPEEPAPEPTPPEPVKETPAPEVVKETPPPEPEPLKELPPEPTPPKAVPVPQPEPAPPKAVPVPQPKPEPVKPKPPVKAVEKPQPKPEPPKPKTTIKPTPLPPKAEPVKPKSTWKPRSAEDIRKSAKLTPIKPLLPKGPSIDPNALASKIRNNIKNINITPLPTGSSGRPGSDNGVASGSGPEAARYFDLVSARLHEMWDQPTRASVGNGQPRVTVHVTVLPDGQVTVTRVDRNSGVAPMDTSVAALLQKLRRLPAYRDFGITASKLSIEVVFELD